MQGSDWSGDRALRGPINLEATSRTWGEDKGISAGLMSTTALLHYICYTAERGSSSTFLFVNNVSGEEEKVAIITQN